MPLRTLVLLAWTHLRLFLRDPAVIFWAVAFPIGLAAALGIAFGGNGEGVGASRQLMGVVAPPGERPAWETWLAPVLEPAAGTPWRIEWYADLPAARVGVQQGNVALIVDGDPHTRLLRYHLDSNHTEARLAQLELSEALRAAAGTPARSARASGLREQTVSMTRRGTRYIDFLVPGLLGIGVMNSCLWGIGWALIEQRQKRLLRRMIASPLRRSVLLGSHLLARLVLTAVEWSLLLVFAVLAFEVPIGGNPLQLMAIFLMSNFAFFGIAVLISSRTDNAQVGNGLVNAVTVPMYLASGVFFSYERFPDWIANIAAWLPLTLVTDTTRAVFFAAPTWLELLPALGALFATGALCFAAGLRIYRWQ